MKASLQGHVGCVKLLLNKGAIADRSDQVRCNDTSSIVYLTRSLCKYCVVEVNSVYLYSMSCFI